MSTKARVCHHLRQPGEGRWTCCEHLLSEAPEDFYRVWQSRGDAHHMACEACFVEQLGEDGDEAPAESFDASLHYEICEVCWRHITETHHIYGSAGALSLVDATPPYTCEVEGLGAWQIPFEVPEHRAMIPMRDASGCYMLDAACNLWIVSEDITFRVFEHVDAGVEFQTDRWALIGPSPCGKYVVVCEASGSLGYVVLIDNSEVTMRLDRGNYYPEQSLFPAVFFTHRGETRIAHGTDWNRVDVSEPATGRCLTTREPEVGENGRAISEHYMDYFNGPLLVSPDQKWLVNEGWVWGPAAAVRAWSLERWLEHNVWEPESGPSSQIPQALLGYDWGWPICFIDDDVLASWSVRTSTFEEDRPGITLVSTKTWRECGYIGANENNCRALYAWEGNLYAASKDGLSVFSPQTGERLMSIEGFGGDAFCPKTGIWFRVEGERLMLRRLGPLQRVEPDAV